MANSLAGEVAYTLRGLGDVEVRRFFAGSSLRLGGVQFAFVMKGVLYLRVNDLTRGKFEDAGCKPFSYAGGDRKMTVASYYEAPADVMEDPSMLRRWVRDAHRAAIQAKSAGRRGWQRRAKRT
ncbi:MAG: TfoX/Sxy family protein [Proteobacteria bacterium]|nr:TfoX/Sxy family protein [Pseudomonadota bacterium]